tara:strand:- start:1191 stop:1364 length:174 start_codon:yes stop_codon:yes gene_type:complete
MRPAPFRRANRRPRRYSKKPKNGCEWASKKSKNCKKKDEFKVKALEACPATCGACGG